VNQATESLCLFSQVSKVFPVMDFEDEAGPSIHGTLNYMLWQAGKVEARRSGHGSSMPCLKSWIQ